MKKSNNHQPKSTRLITVGWKHSVKNTFTQVTEQKGGGKFKVAVSHYGRHIYDVITSLRRGFEMGDHL